MFFLHFARYPLYYGKGYRSHELSRSTTTSRLLSQSMGCRPTDDVLPTKREWSSGLVCLLETPHERQSLSSDSKTPAAGLYWSKENRVFDENTSVLFTVRVDHYLVGWITSIHCFITVLPVLRGLVKLPVSIQVLQQGF